MKINLTVKNGFHRDVVGCGQLAVGFSEVNMVNTQRNSNFVCKLYYWVYNT